MSPAPTPRSGIKHLVSLRDELNALVDRIVETEEEPLPALDDIESPHGPLSYAAMQAISVTRELLSLLQGTHGALDKVFGFHISSALRVSIEAHVVETLKEAAAEGKKALHVDDIAKSSCINPNKLARVLRTLAANYVFIEAQPDTFALNRPALLLDTGKSVKELKSTKDFYSDTNGSAAMIAHTADDIMKGSAFLADVALDPSTANSASPAEAGSARALHLDAPLWEHWGKEENAHLSARFDKAMWGTQMMTLGTSALQGFPFKDLPEDATLVDVGSGIGTVSLEIFKAVPQIKVVLQDRPEVMASAKQIWQKSVPDRADRFETIPHDFFAEQPVKGAAVYLMRFIIHDWADEQSIQILQHLANAALSSSRLILIEQTYTYVPPSGRTLSATPYAIDMQMLSALHSQERTEEQYAALGEKAGWRLEKVWKTGEGGKVDGPFRHYEFALKQ
ncbi:hypothetical protein JCM6882_004924 [Rhodosporidiobolus microsporus]